MKKKKKNRICRFSGLLSDPSLFTLTWHSAASLFFLVSCLLMPPFDHAGVRIIQRGSPVRLLLQNIPTTFVLCRLLSLHLLASELMSRPMDPR